MNKTTEALKLAEEALNAMLTHMGMDEDEWTKPTFNQAREALAAIREALADHIADAGKVIAEPANTRSTSEYSEPVKQEPIGYAAQSVIDWLSSEERTASAYSGINLYKNPTDNSTTPLYASPVDAKAIRSEALEEAAKVCDFENHQLTGMRMDNEAWAAKNCAAAIRGLK